MLVLSGCHGWFFHDADVLDHVLDLTMTPTDAAAPGPESEAAG